MFALLRRVSVSICAAIWFLFLFVTFTPLVSWYAGRLAGPWNDPEGDTLIVLAGAGIEGLPAENTMLRCYYATRAYMAGHFRKIVVAGFETSSSMRDLLAYQGVPPEIIVEEKWSKSTRENALNTAKLLAGDNSSKVLLTSDYHMFRAVRAFRKAGLDVLPRPVPDIRKRAVRLVKRWPAFLEEAVETVKIAYYSLRGWM